MVPLKTEPLATLLDKPSSYLGETFGDSELAVPFIRFDSFR